MADHSKSYKTFGMRVGLFRCVWRVTDLWEAARGLEPRPYHYQDFWGWDEDRWFGGAPSMRQVAEHMKQVQAADLSYPIILADAGKWFLSNVMDGHHRMCKAAVLGLETIPAVQFEKTPTPDSMWMVVPCAQCRRAVDEHVWTPSSRSGWLQEVEKKSSCTYDFLCWECRRSVPPLTGPSTPTVTTRGGTNLIFRNTNGSA